MPPPAPDVLEAFGAGGVVPERLTGGRGCTWAAGSVVLRPADGEETPWRSSVLAELAHGDGADDCDGDGDRDHAGEGRGHSGVTVPRPVRATTGEWTIGGWEAWERLPGRTDPTRVEDAVAVAHAFERAVADRPRPGFLDRKRNPWADADRMVWGEADLPAEARRDPTVDRLVTAFRPVPVPPQLVHGDVLGNVLYAPGRPPAVIDWAPYWRPAGLGAAIAAVDAVCWHGIAPDRLGPLGSGVPGWPHLLVRATAFRVVTLHLAGTWDADAVAAHAQVLDAIC